MPKLDGIGLAAAGVGSLFVYAGVRGYSVPHAIQALVKGEPPSTGGQANPIGTPQNSPSGSLGGGGGDLAGNFLQHLGHCYLYGGAPGASGQSCWDCSSSTNWVANIQTGLAIPGAAPGKYDASQHGPSTLTWLAWAPLHLTRVPRSGVQRSDVVVWQTHMGVAVDNGSYVSAAGTNVVARGHEDTVVQSIDGGGPGLEVPTFWRYPGGAAGSPGLGPPPPGKTGTL